MVGCVRCLEEQQNRHRGTATRPSICTVPADVGGTSDDSKGTGHVDTNFLSNLDMKMST